MIVKRIGVKEAKAILFDDEIYSRVSYDDAPKPINLKKAYFIGGFLRKKLFAVMIYFDKGDYETCHINVLKQFRGQYGALFGKKALKFRNNKDLYTTIPDIFKDVRKFAEMFGFELIKTTKSKNLRNGKNYNIDILRLL